MCLLKIAKPDDNYADLAHIIMTVFPDVRVSL